MAAADVTKSTQHVLEDLVLNEGVKQFFSAKNVAFDLPAINTVTNGTQDIPISGVAAGDVAIVNFRTAITGGLVFVGATTAADKVTLTFYNTTAGTVNASAVNVDCVVFDIT